MPRASLDDLDAQVAFLGVPYEGGTPQPGNRTGQAEGPAATRRQSYEQFEHEMGWYDIEADRDYLARVTMADVGDVAIQGSDVEGSYARITEAARRIAESGAVLAAIGGRRSCATWPGSGYATSTASSCSSRCASAGRE